MKKKLIAEILNEIAVEGVAGPVSVWPGIERAWNAKKRIRLGGLQINDMLRVVRVAILVIVIVGAASFTVWARVKQQQERTRKEIGIMTFFEQQKMEPVDEGEGRAVTVVALAGTGVSLAEARQLMDTELLLPTWVPEGFELRDDEVYVFTINGPVLHLAWEKEGEELWKGIFLTVGRYGVLATVGEGSVREVQIKGVEAAALVEGTWNSNGETREWKQDGSIALMWYQGQYLYELRANLDIITEEELIKMAESMIP